MRPRGKTYLTALSQSQPYKMPTATLSRRQLKVLVKFLLYPDHVTTSVRPDTRSAERSWPAQPFTRVEVTFTLVASLPTPREKMNRNCSRKRGFACYLSVRSPLRLCSKGGRTNVCPSITKRADVGRWRWSRRTVDTLHSAGTLSAAECRTENSWAESSETMRCF
jgi:hypothetical protein